MSNAGSSRPMLIIAWGIAVATGLWGLAKVLPALATAGSILIQGLGVAGGLAFAAATTGFATAGTVAAWLPVAASAGLAATGASVTYLVVAKIVEKGKERPYEWLLPILGLLSIFFVELSSDQLVPTVLQRAIYSLATGLLTIGGGLLLMQRSLLVRAIGFGLPFLPSVIVWAALVRARHITGALLDFIRSGSTGAIGLLGVFTLGVTVAVLGVLLPVRSSADGDPGADPEQQV